MAYAPPQTSIDAEVALNREWAHGAFGAQSGRQVEGIPGTCDLPFSFVYGGKPFSEIAASWRRQVADEAIDATRSRRTLTLTDPVTGLEVKAAATIYGDTAGVDWVLTFTNTGSADTPLIDRVSAVDVTLKLPAASPVVLHRLRGNVTGAEYSPEDFTPFDVPIPADKRVEFGPEIALSSHMDSPFFNLEHGSGGVVVAVGWSGHWGASVARAADGSTRVEAGMRDTKLRLRPGEAIRTPRILLLHWTGGDEARSYNLFRRTMFAHVLPRIGGELVVPPIAHATNLFYSQNSGTEAEILEYADSIKGLGFECLWLDAFYSRGGWPDGIGNYAYPIETLVDLERYPRSLTPISAAARREGMKFLVWTAPERACKGTILYEKHPEWFLGLPDQQTKLTNMGDPAVREYMTRYLLDLIRTYRIDCIRFDCGAFLGELRMNDAKEPDRGGITEIRYHEGLYRMWDDILAAMPNVFIDNCCGGGNRIDLETCARSLPLWRTDGVGYPLAMWTPRDMNQAALHNQVITAGLSRYMPFSTSGTMGTSPYLFRSAVNAGVVFTEDTRPADYNRAQLKEAIAECKRIRKYFFGDYYPLCEVTSSPGAWCVLQYHRQAEQDGMVLAFRRHKSPFPVFVCALRDIEPDASYSVTIASTYRVPAPVPMKGAELRALRLDIGEAPGSLLIEYRKLVP